MVGMRSPSSLSEDLIPSPHRLPVLERGGEARASSQLARERSLDRGPPGADRQLWICPSGSDVTSALVVLAVSRVDCYETVALVEASSAVLLWNVQSSRCSDEAPLRGR